MEMQQNIENYRTMAGVEALQLVDLEAKPHLVSTRDPCPNQKELSVPKFHWTQSRFLWMGISGWFLISNTITVLCSQSSQMKYCQYQGWKNWEKVKMPLEKQYVMVKSRTWYKHLSPCLNLRATSTPLILHMGVEASMNCSGHTWFPSSQSIGFPLYLYFSNSTILKLYNFSLKWKLNWNHKKLGGLFFFQLKMSPFLTCDFQDDWRTR